MARFDLYRPAGSSVLLDVQSDYFADFGRRVVVPLLPNIGLPRPLPGLQPMMTVGDEVLVMLTHRIASVPKQVLGPSIGNVAGHQDDITRALDLLFTGF